MVKPLSSRVAARAPVVGRQLDADPRRRGDGDRYPLADGVEVLGLDTLCHELALRDAA